MLNPWMHSRNPYRTPPDFQQLALQHPDLLRACKLDVNGKVQVDFKDPACLRALTRCLLRADFDLEVHIPEDRLVPTLPLRLNYILWVEDLLVTLDPREHVSGIDIGTGACAVYPLLGARKNGWRMIGTETDDKSYQTAHDNVKNNNLEELVTVKHNPTTSLLEHCFAEDKDAKYEFCMCNPPFYSSMQELYESRSTARPPPKNCFTGSPQELITEGGEVEFIRKLIKESKQLKHDISIFTTMVGHKSSLKELASELEAEGIEYTHTEFCQGRTTRWGLAWTFQVNCKLRKLTPPRSESRKKNIPMTFVLPPLPALLYDTDTIGKQVRLILDNLNITHRVIRKKAPKIVMEIRAHTNTWSNQRRKRRLLKQTEGEGKKIKFDTSTNCNISNEKNTVTDETITESNEASNKLIEIEAIYKENNNSEFQLNNDTLEHNAESNASKNEGPNKNNNQHEIKEVEEIKDSIDNKTKRQDETSIIKIDVKDNNNFKKKCDAFSNADDGSKTVDNDHKSGKSQQNLNQNNSEQDAILHALLSLSKQENDVVLGMEFIGGTAGKDGMHQVFQYIKNNWK